MTTDRLAVRVMALSIPMSLLLGCVAVEPRYHAEHEVAAFKLHVADGNTIRETYRARCSDYGQENQVSSTPWGWYDPLKGEVWVYCVDRKRGTPDFRALGHEIWHSPKAGGATFHGRFNMPMIGEER